MCVGGQYSRYDWHLTTCVSAGLSELNDVTVCVTDGGEFLHDGAETEYHFVTCVTASHTGRMSPVFFILVKYQQATAAASQVHVLHTDHTLLMNFDVIFLFLFLFLFLCPAAKLLQTPLRRVVVPPPMSHRVVELPCPASQCTAISATSTCPARFASLLCDGRLSVYEEQLLPPRADRTKDKSGFRVDDVAPRHLGVVG